MLALGVDGIRSLEDHEAFLGIREAIPILTHHASFLGRCLLALSFFWSVGLSQKAFEELAFLVEVLDGVSVVGVGAIHELIEVVRQALLGLLAHAIGHGDQSSIGQLAPIPLILFAPLCDGALVLVLALGLALVPASTKDRSNHLFAGGMGCGDVEQVAGGTGLQTTELVDQGLTGCPRKEHTDDVHVDDIRKEVASF